MPKTWGLMAASYTSVKGSPWGFLFFFSFGLVNNLSCFIQRSIVARATSTDSVKESSVEDLISVSSDVHQRGFLLPISVFRGQELSRVVLQTKLKTSTSSSIPPADRIEFLARAVGRTDRKFLQYSWYLGIPEVSISSTLRAQAKTNVSMIREEVAV